jgi:hypothetical protein
MRWRSSETDLFPYYLHAFSAHRVCNNLSYEDILSVYDHSPPSRTPPEAGVFFGVVPQRTKVGIHEAEAMYRALRLIAECLPCCSEDSSPRHNTFVNYHSSGNTQVVYSHLKQSYHGHEILPKSILYPLLREWVCGC